MLNYFGQLTCSAGVVDVGGGGAKGVAPWDSAGLLLEGGLNLPR